MTKVSGSVEAPGGVQGSGTMFVVNHNADHSLVTLRYRFPKAEFDAAEDGFEAGGHKFNRGSFIVHGVSAEEIEQGRARNWDCRLTRSIRRRR